MSMPEIGSEEAKRRLDAGEGQYLDVRTVAEFNSGHAVGAINVPVAQLNPASGRMELNADFVRVVEAVFSRETVLIVGCKSGQRSAAAIELLQQRGFVQLVNLSGGFGGVVDPTGQVLEEGWSTLGYPVARGDAHGVSYESLVARIS